MTKKNKDTPFFYELIEKPEDIIKMAKKVEDMDKRTKKIIHDLIPLETFAIRKDPFFNTSMRVAVGTNTSTTSTSTGTTPVVNASTGGNAPSSSAPSSSVPSSSAPIPSTSAPSTIPTPSPSQFSPSLPSVFDSQHVHVVDIVKLLYNIKKSTDIILNNTYAFGINDDEFKYIVDAGIFLYSAIFDLRYISTTIVEKTPNYDDLVHSEIIRLFPKINECFSFVLFLVMVCINLNLYNQDSLDKGLIANRSISSDDYDRFKSSMDSLYEYFNNKIISNPLVNSIANVKISDSENTIYLLGEALFYDDNFFGVFFKKTNFQSLTSITQISDVSMGRQQNEPRNIVDLSTLLFFFKCFSKFKNTQFNSISSENQSIIRKTYLYLMKSFNITKTISDSINPTQSGSEGLNDIDELAIKIGHLTNSFEKNINPPHGTDSPSSSSVGTNTLSPQSLTVIIEPRDQIFNVDPGLLDFEKSLIIKKFSKYQFPSIDHIPVIVKYNNEQVSYIALISISDAYFSSAMAFASEAEKRNQFSLKNSCDIVKSCLLGIVSLNDQNSIHGITILRPNFQYKKVSNLLSTQFKKNSNKDYKVDEITKDQFITFTKIFNMIYASDSVWTHESRFAYITRALFDIETYITTNHPGVSKLRPMNSQMKGSGKKKKFSSNPSDNFQFETPQTDRPHKERKMYEIDPHGKKRVMNGNGVKEEEYTITPEKLEILINEYNMGNKSSIVKGDILTGLNELVMHRKISRKEFYNIKNNLNL